MQYCTCGFTDESIRLSDVPSRSAAAVATMAELLRVNPSTSLQRPDADRWSAVEYAAHVRDVVIIIRDRIVVGLVEDNPTFTPMYRDERIGMGLYADETAETVATDIEAAQAMFARLFTRVDPDGQGRPVQYGSPDPIHTTVGWMGQQAVHEAEHHLADVKENLRRLAG